MTKILHTKPRNNTKHALWLAGFLPQGYQVYKPLQAPGILGDNTGSWKIFPQKNEQFGQVGHFKELYYTSQPLKFLKQLQRPLFYLIFHLQVHYLIHGHSLVLHGFITNSQYDQCPVGLIAQLVEHCTGIAEVKVSNPVEAWNFFRLSFRNCLSCINNCEDVSSILHLSSAVPIYYSELYFC